MSTVAGRFVQNLRPQRLRKGGTVNPSPAVAVQLEEMPQEYLGFMHFLATPLHSRHLMKNRAFLSQLYQQIGFEGADGVIGTVGIQFQRLQMRKLCYVRRKVDDSLGRQIFFRSLMARARLAGSWKLSSTVGPEWRVRLHEFRIVQVSAA